MMLKDTSEVGSEHILLSAQRLVAQRSQNAVLENISDAKDFDSIRGGQNPGQNGN